jgi:hypothetical protein
MGNITAQTVAVPSWSRAAGMAPEFDPAVPGARGGPLSYGRARHTTQMLAFGPNSLPASSPSAPTT